MDYELYTFHKTSDYQTVVNIPILLLIFYTFDISGPVYRYLTTKKSNETAISLKIQQGISHNVIKLQHVITNVI